MTKADLRVLYKEQRNLLQPAAVEALSREICKNFSALSLDGVNYVHLFYPIPGKKEVDSLLIADWLRRKRRGIKLVLPKSDPDDHSLTHMLWEDDTRLAMNNWGITEPESGTAVDATALDLIIVPLLAYDGLGNRVGYGKGFYDRFLAECRPDAHKIGLSFFEAEEDPITPVDDTDIKLDACVTPFGIYRF